jgi:putative ABC transport system permease protein
VLILDLAVKSLRNRLLSTSLTVGSIALSVALLVGVENVRIGMRESFSNTVSQTDLIVGAKGGTIQLLLYSVFGMGSPTANLSWETYQEWREHPAVAWTIPYALGDSHRGFRVIGTDASFYERYRYRGGQPVRLDEGTPARGVFDVVLGADVAEELGYGLGDPVAVTHGMGAVGFLNHDDKPFEVVGILEKTFTPVDRAIYVTLEGIEAIHFGWEDGAPPAPGEGASREEVLAMDEIPISQVTSFFVGTTNRRDVLRLQREINDFEDEPMMAVIPGVALSEMWRGIGYAEDGLRVVTIFVVVVGLMGMLVSLYTSLNERRREMAILRAVGAGPRRIVALLVLESGVLAAAGAFLGLGLVYALLLAGQPVVESQVGLFIPIRPPGLLEWTYLGAVVAAGVLIGLVPAVKAYRNALHDGLALRV